MRSTAVFLTVWVLVALQAAPAYSQSKKPAFSDEAVATAIKKGVKYLWSQQRADGSWEAYGRPGKRAYPLGPGALAMYALLESGVSPQNAQMVKALRWQVKGTTHKTYVLGLRANVWELANRGTKSGEGSGKYRKYLEKDVTQLIKSTSNGSYGYDSKGDGKSSGDNSNSQFGLLGVWAGKRGGVEVPNKYWWLVQGHWLNRQRFDGGWIYAPGWSYESKATMCAAGMASLFVCFDNNYNKAFAGCNVGRDAELVLKPMERGLDWFDKNFKVGSRTANYYYLYGVERVGLASGYKYFGKVNWYKAGAAKLLETQKADGSWSGVVNTSFAILFLVRGQHSVMFNKLKFTGDWNNRPRDLACLTRWVSRTFERTVNWQIITFKVPVEEWHDAPIVYISACKAPTFSETELQTLRDFVWQGGTIFSCAECKGSGFKTAIRKVYAKLFPRYEMVPLVPEHEIYSIHFKLRSRPKFHMITNGVRPLVIHTDEDLPVHWQLNRRATQRWAFEAAANVAMYVTDKGSLRHRGVSPWPEKTDPGKEARTLRLVRLKHSGNYNPELLAHERFSRLMTIRAKTKVELPEPIEIAKLPGSGADLATLTGTGPLNLSGAQTDALKSFVAAGGTVLIDAAGGSRKFADSAEKLIAEMYGTDALRRLSPRSGVYRLKGMEIDKAKYRRRTRDAFPSRRPNLSAVMLNDRPAVIFSREDITAALVGYPSYKCMGYDPQTAFELVRNILLFGAEHKKKQPAKPIAGEQTPPKPE